MLYILSLFTTEAFFDVAIETWPEWDLNFECTTNELHSVALTNRPIRP